MRKYETIQKIREEYQNIYKDCIVGYWQGGNDLELYICDVITDKIIYVVEFEFKYKWNYKTTRKYKDYLKN